jgi:hypothetical protein
MLSGNFRAFKKIVPLAIMIWYSTQGSGLFAREWQQVRLKGIAIDAEIVKTDAEQQLGLSNRFSLPEGQAMLFLYDEPGTRIFWMKRMNFPIDIVWFHKESVVMFEENVPNPETDVADDDLVRYGFGVAADMVLELPAGFIKRNRINFGDTLRYRKGN